MMATNAAAARHFHRCFGQAASIASRSYATSTMASLSGNRIPRAEMTSTVYHAESKDFSTAVATDTDDQTEMHHDALISAYRSIAEKTPAPAHPLQKITANAREMDLVEAASVAKNEFYDKILILLQHGEAYIDEEDPRDPGLSPKGIGQALNLSRRTASFCNKETGLSPELFVVSPLRRATQTALLAFPDCAPGSIRAPTWICHGGCMERANGNISDFVSPAGELEAFFPGVDYSLYRKSVDPNVANIEAGSMTESKMDLLRRTDDFLAWLKSREERIIVVSSHSTWLQSFCGFSLEYHPEPCGTDPFKAGELRSVAIKFG